MLLQQILSTLKTAIDSIQRLEVKVNALMDIKDIPMDNIAELNTDIAETQNATCELSEDVDARITDIEIALCELSEQ